ncbi:uncharacterized protein LOC132057590 [Lycium ferocissimum]|uniref:uncharacterized protein LOC132057590 n=1 Tax=Lycium ferocissimum TaxID=112874 RepID=UPI002816173B|nr:uncharacterized protein LOC132057590 [Lycium ferocissimum]
MAPSQSTKTSPQRRLGIYVGMNLLHYKIFGTYGGDLFMARFVDCHFDESIYPALGGENKQLKNEIDWNALSLSHLDPRTNQCEQEVQKIICLQNTANQLPDAFTDLSRITKSHILAANAPIRVDVLIGQSIKANESKPQLKHGRPIDSKDKNPRKRKRANNQNDNYMEAVAQEEQRDITTNKTSEEVQVPEK